MVTKIVKQETDYDCAVCCFMMLTGKSREEVISAIGDAYDPEEGLNKTHMALCRLGFNSGEYMVMHRDWCLSYQMFARLAWRRRTLLTVPSLNLAGGWHMVYHDGEQLLDPSTKKQYINLDQLEPEEIVLFSEVRS